MSKACISACRSPELPSNESVTLKPSSSRPASNQKGDLIFAVRKGIVKISYDLLGTACTPWRSGHPAAPGKSWVRAGIAPVSQAQSVPLAAFLAHTSGSLPL